MNEADRSAQVRDYRTLEYQLDDRVAVIALARPDKLNALNQELCRELQLAVRRADADDAVRVVVLTGKGGRAFSAGYDLTEPAEVDRDRGILGWEAAVRNALVFTEAVWNCTKPVIAMIDGYCLAGGLELAQMCDIRYASDDSRFAVIETRFSSGVATLVMPWVIGTRSRELIYTGDIIDAQEALRIGLVNRVFPKADLEREVMKVANRMSRVALAALQWNKRAINNTYEAMGFRTALAYGAMACAVMDATGSPELVTFDTLTATEGLETALTWRKQLFAEFE